MTVKFQLFEKFQTERAMSMSMENESTVNY